MERQLAVDGVVTVTVRFSVPGSVCPVQCVPVDPVQCDNAIRLSAVRWVMYPSLLHDMTGRLGLADGLVARRAPCLLADRKDSQAIGRKEIEIIRLDTDDSTKFY